MHNEKKYILTDETIKINDHTLHRIKAVKDFGTVKAGDLGGFVENECNLSHGGTCWVYDDACVFGDAHVYGQTRIYDRARVFGGACVYGEVRIYGRACVYGEANIYGEATVCDSADISGKAKISGEADIYGEATVCDSADISGKAKISGKAYISSKNDICVIGPIGSRNSYLTFYKTESGGIHVHTGCFNGTIHKFKIAVRKTHKFGSRHRKDYLTACKIANSRILRANITPAIM